MLLARVLKRLLSFVNSTRPNERIVVLSSRAIDNVLLLCINTTLLLVVDALRVVVSCLSGAALLRFLPVSRSLRLDCGHWQGLGITTF